MTTHDDPGGVQAGLLPSLTGAAPVAERGFGGESTMGAQMASLDWRQTRVGPVEHWPSYLRTVVSLLLGVSAPVVVLWGPERVQLYNDAYRALLGVARHPAALGQPLADGWPELGAVIEPACRTVFEGRSTHVRGVRLTVEREGLAGEHLVDGALSPVRDEQGVVVGVYATLTETTERTGEDRAPGGDLPRRPVTAPGVTELLESMQDAFFALDRDYRIVLVNRNQERLSGLPREQLIGRPFYEVFPAARDPRSKYWTEYHRVVEQGVAVAFEEYYEPLDLWTEVRAHPTEAGGIAVFYRDINARKQLERERAEAAAQVALSESRYRSFVEATAQIVWTATMTGEMREDSTSWRSFTGQTVEECLGHGWFDALHPEDVDRAREAWNHAIAGGGAYEVEYRLRRADGVYRVTLARGAPVRDAAGAMHSWMGVNVDITEQKAAEEERARLLVRAQRAQAEAEAARAEAERANTMKDEFLATVSHELRTPLNAILGWAQMLQGGALDAAMHQRAIETIARNARSQARLVEDLLDLSRILQGKFRLAVGPVEMVRVVEAALDAVRPAAQAKGVRLQPVLDSHATIVGDGERLQQVAWNLLSNAIKFTPKGGRVQVILRRAPSYVEFVVDDTGEGIDAAFVPHVFEPFRQADGGITRRSGGLGLGLSIVRSLVELHGGTVTVSSQGRGQGATFSVRLPVAPLRVERAAPGTETRSSDAGPARFECPVVLAGLRVLVVDDERDTRELIAFVLRQCEAVVTTAGSSAEAFARLESERFDVLVSDVGMPGEDGLSLLRRVRQLPAGEGGRTPAVALTAYARSEDRAQALRAGFNVHLAKPIEPTELLLVVAGLVVSR